MRKEINVVLTLLAACILCFNASFSFAADAEIDTVSVTVTRSIPGSAMDIRCGSGNVARISGTNIRNTDVFGFGISYRDFSLTYNQTLFNGPKLYDMIGDLFFGCTGFEIMVQKYRGFHWAGKGEDVETDEAGNYINYDGSLTITNYRLHCFYFLFDDYSYSSAYINKTGSRRFCWSPFFRVSPGYFSLRSTQPIIPSSQYSAFDSGLHSMTEFDCFNCSLSAGLTAIVPLWKFYFSPIVTIGCEPQLYSHNGAYGRQRGVGNNLTYDFRLLLAFAGDILTAGGWMCNDNQFATANNAVFMVSNLKFEAFAGIRF
jgi:hypothetical protein